MYKLLLESDTDEVTETCVFYSSNYNHITNVKDLFCLNFLRELSCDEFYCTSEENIPGIYIMLSPAEKYREYLERKGQWKLEKKYDYEFQIDIYQVRQCGCEENVSLRDIENGRLLEMFKESKESGRIDKIPTLKIEQYEEDYEKGRDDLLYYTAKYPYVEPKSTHVIPYDVYLTTYGDLDEYLKNKEYS